MADHTASQVADYFLCFCGEHGDCLTNLKLQKIIYYAQAWHLALKNKPLFDDVIQAWVHGPVVPSVYGRFKKYGWQPISESVRNPNFTVGIQKHLVEVFSVYGKYTAWDLERMTHQEAPWVKARAGVALDAESTNIISQDNMRDFYKKLAAKKKV